MLLNNIRIGRVGGRGGCVSKDPFIDTNTQGAVRNVLCCDEQYV